MHNLSCDEFQQVRQIGPSSRVVRSQRRLAVKAGSLSFSFSVVKYDAAHKIPQHALRLNGAVWSTIVIISIIFALIAFGDSSRAAGLLAQQTLIVPIPPVTKSTFVDRPQAPFKRQSLKKISRGVIRLGNAARRTLPLGNPDGGNSVESAEDHAVTSAFSSGGVTEWFNSELGIHGYVIAGPVYAESERFCRDISILTRRTNGTDTVEPRKKCSA